MSLANVRPVGEKCGAPRDGREPCGQVAGWGTDHLGSGPCKLHGGSFPTVQVHHGREIASFRANRALAMFGVPLENADPEQTLLDLVSEAAGNVAFLGNQVRELAEQKGDEDDPNALTQGGLWRRAGGGYSKGRFLFGPEIAVDKDGTEHVIGEDVRAMVKLYGEWADKLAKYAKAALDAGIERRRVEMAEQQGEVIVVVVSNVLVRLGMSQEVLASARTMIADEFRRLGSGE